nr:nuclease-related domain-containing protein [Pleurocapsa sp. PCC 7327]
MADRELGLVVIEVKSIPIDKIVNITGHRWEYQNFYIPFGNPYQQAENQLFAILKYCDREPILQDKISARALVALPLISQRQWQEKSSINYLAICLFYSKIISILLHLFVNRSRKRHP